MEVCETVSVVDKTAQDTVVYLCAQVTAFSTYGYMHRQVCGVDVDMSMEKMKSYGDIRRFIHKPDFKKIDSMWGASVSIPYDNVSFHKITCVIMMFVSLCILYTSCIFYTSCICMLWCILHAVTCFA